MKVIVAGASGLIGSALVPYLKEKGHQVTKLTRNSRRSSPDSIFWDPEKQEIAPEQLEKYDAVINLAGENIAKGRWTATKKQKIRKSRVEGTRLLCQTLKQLASPPQVLLNASAVGYYGNRNDEVLTEQSALGQGFLCNVCREWETATQSAEKKGIRIVKMRIGVVLSKHGGALKRMLLPFKLGLGGVIGNGSQYVSWIAIDDLVEVIHHLLTTSSFRGVVNVVSPNPVTNLEFTKTLGRVLKRPTIFPLPAFVARLVFGEMGEELLLSSTRVKPEVLLHEGYRFRFPQLEEALQHQVGSRK